MGYERVLRFVGISAVTALALTGCGGDDDDDSGATVKLTTPTDGATVAGGVKLVMEADGITIEEAGEAREGAGHFHVIADDGCVATGEAVPKDADHVHFGSGAATGTIYLAPGEHELCLQVADGVHSALAATDTITVNVGIESIDEWCGVVKEIDDLFEAVDTGGDDFAVRQVGYENIVRLFDQVEGGLEHVDESARDDVATSLGVGKSIAAAFVDVENEADAADVFNAIFEEQGDEMEAGAPYISDTCGVEIS